MNETTPAPTTANETVRPPRRGRLHGFARWLAITAGVIGILLNINQLFNFQFFIGALIIDTSYYYLLAGLFLATVFLIYPAYDGDQDHIGWYDWLAVIVILFITGFLAWNGDKVSSSEVSTFK